MSFTTALASSWLGIACADADALLTGRSRMALDRVAADGDVVEFRFQATSGQPKK